VREAFNSLDLRDLHFSLIIWGVKREGIRTRTWTGRGAFIRSRPFERKRLKNGSATGSKEDRKKERRT